MTIGLSVGQFTACGHQTFVTPSRSQPGTLRHVWVGEDGKIRCTCPGYKFYERCYHADALAEQLDRELRCRRCGHIDAPGDAVSQRLCVNLAACLSRSRLTREVLEWARRYYPDADYTINQYWSYYLAQYQKAARRSGQRVEVAS